MSDDIGIHLLCTQNYILMKVARYIFGLCVMIYLVSLVALFFQQAPVYPIIIHDTETVTTCEREPIRVFHIKPKLEANPYE